jgi:FKBP-type peptidyl-prolyl cis-trans isomerase (trigger factor)
MKTQLVQKALANSKFEISEDDIKNSVDAMMAEYTTYAEYYGYDLETYVTAATGYTMEQFEEYCRTNAIQTLQSGLLQAAILEEEGLELSDEEYKVRAEAYMPMFGYETLEEFEAAYTKEKITNQCLADMVMEVMVREAVVEE